MLLVAAVLAVVVGVGLAMRPQPAHVSTTDVAGPIGATPRSLATDRPAAKQKLNVHGGFYRGRTTNGAATSPTTVPASANNSASSNGTVDGAKIVKTGSLDLEVPKDQLTPTLNRVTGIAKGLGGYVSESKTDLQGDVATAQTTIRVPVANFETATSRIGALEDVDVLGDSETGSDVTAEYTDLQAQLTAATTERDSLLAVLSNATTIGDILAVHDRIAAVNTQIEQLQGQINLLGNQAAYSSIAVTITEKSPKKAAAAPAKPPSGLSKAWKDARRGFSDSIEWLIARSGGALIVLLAALALVFGIRYLYPVLRRALL